MSTVPCWREIVERDVDKDTKRFSTNLVVCSRKHLELQALIVRTMLWSIDNQTRKSYGRRAAAAMSSTTSALGGTWFLRVYTPFFFVRERERAILEMLTAGGRDRLDFAGMAESADAADSKSAEGNLVGVRPPLPAPNCNLHVQAGSTRKNAYGQAFLAALMK